MNCSFPGHVIYVAAKIAKLKKLTLEQVLMKNIILALECYFFSQNPKYYCLNTLEIFLSLALYFEIKYNKFSCTCSI